MEGEFESLNFPVFNSPLPEHDPMSIDGFDAFNMEICRILLIVNLTKMKKSDVQ
jgi:hypothetical protein